MSYLKTIMKEGKKAATRSEALKPRQHLNVDALNRMLRSGFDKIRDRRIGNNIEITLTDALMSGFAVFALKDPSLLAFDERRRVGASNLQTIYGIGQIPCDTAMREILDGVDPNDLRPLFRDAFRKLQRGKVLEKMVFMEGCYLLNLDGTGYFSSNKRHSPSCMKKVSSKGKTTYYLQMLGAAIVHPDFKEVIPVCPEMIIKQDGETKNDCERNAAKRFLAHFRREHPHLPVIINEDALSSNAPHIRDLEAHNVHYILGVKPGDHQYLFEDVDMALETKEAIEFDIQDEHSPEITHYFRIVNDVPLNKSNQDLRVNFLEYWEENTRTGKIQRFSWVTDFTITKENAMTIMRGGRARWKIENETFNTLKNQGYNFGHNYGLGKKNLSVVFVLLMMLAFLIDQIQQLCCPLFNALWKKWKTKKSLWEKIRFWFHGFVFKSMEHLYRTLLGWNPIDLR